MVLGVIRIYFTKQLTGPARASMRVLAQAGLECIVYICVVTGLGCIVNIYVLIVL